MELSSYKLVQFLKDYVNPEGVETPIKICSQTAQNWLRKLRYEYKDICKDIFIDRYKRSDMVKDRNKFLTRMEDLKPYRVEFKEDGIMKPKIYLSNCVVGGEDC